MPERWRVIQNAPTPNLGRTAYWKTWGLGPQESGEFTKDGVRAVAAELKQFGIDWIMLDYGWFTAEGNWSSNPDVFSDDDDLRSSIAELHADGFRVGLWFQPVQLDTSDDDVGPLLDHVIRDEDGDIFVDDDDLALLDPSKPEVRSYVLDQLDRLFNLGADHIYLDSQMATSTSTPRWRSLPPRPTIDRPIRCPRTARCPRSTI